MELDTEQAAHVARMVLERAAGRGWKAIATGLSKDGIPTPSGNGHWAAATVQSLVSSEAALGVWTGPRGARVEDAWPAMVDRTSWDAAGPSEGEADGRSRTSGPTYRRYGALRVLPAGAKRTSNQQGHVSYGCVNRDCPARASIGATLLDTFISGLVDERLSRLRGTAEGASDDTYAALLAARDDATAATARWLADTEMEARLGTMRYRARLIALSDDENAKNEALAAYQPEDEPRPRRRAARPHAGPCRPAVGAAGAGVRGVPTCRVRAPPTEARSHGRAGCTGSHARGVGRRPNAR